MRTHYKTFVPAFVCIAAAIFSGCQPKQNISAPANLNGVNHIVVIYLENHSFDNLYGEFPGANGLHTNPTGLCNGLGGEQWNSEHPQLDTATGKPFDTLPQPMNTLVKPNVPDMLFPANLPNAPFPMEKYVGTSEDVPDLLHKFYQEQMEIDGGKMDKYASIEDAKGLTMGYWHTMELPLAKYAKQYTLCDIFFHSAFGGSFLNHQWLIAAQMPRWAGVSPDAKSAVDANGTLQKDGFADPDGYLINTCFPQNNPHPANAPQAYIVPNSVMTNTTIGDELTAAGVSWAWYSGGWSDALAGHPAETFQYHHQPFNYYAAFSDSTAEGRANKAKHLLDEAAFIAAVNDGTLPQVSFVKPIGFDNEHPGYADLFIGEVHADSLVQLLMQSLDFNSTLIIITYDEHGGQWDHVPPPTVDKWGPGSRVPAILIGAMVKKGCVDHTEYETVSILSLIEKRFGLHALGTRDAAANPFSGAFVF